VGLEDFLSSFRIYTQAPFRYPLQNNDGGASQAASDDSERNDSNQDFISEKLDAYASRSAKKKPKNKKERSLQRRLRENAKNVLNLDSSEEESEDADDEEVDGSSSLLKKRPRSERSADFLSQDQDGEGFSKRQKFSNAEVNQTGSRTQSVKESGSVHLPQPQPQPQE